MGVPHVGRLLAVLETTFGTFQVVGSERDQRIVRAPDLSGLVTGRAPNQTHYDRLHETMQRVDLSEFGSKVKLPVYLDGLAAGLNSAASSGYPANDVSVLLRGLMGGVFSAAAGSSVLSAYSVSTILVQAGMGARFSAGGACVINGAMRGLAAVSGDVLVLKMALSAAPTTGNVVYNCSTFYFDEDEWGGSGDTLQMRYAGNLTNDWYQLYGVAGDFTISTEIDQLLAMNLDLQVADWRKFAGGYTLAGASYAGGGPLACKTGQIQWQTVGTSTVNIIHADKFSVTPGIKFHPYRALSGVETLVRYYMLRAETKAQFEVAAYQNFDEFWTDTDTQSTLKYFHLVIGSAPISAGSGTGMVGIELPTCQYEMRPKRLSNGELVKVQVNLEAREDQAVTTPTAGVSAQADMHRSKLKIHLA